MAEIIIDTPGVKALRLHEEHIDGIFRASDELYARGSSEYTTSPKKCRGNQGRPGRNLYVGDTW